MSSTITRLTIALLSTVTPFVLAGPETIVLPAFLIENLPPCARDCAARFVQEELSSCVDSGSIECLCEARSANGYTLGEGALACVADECPFDYVNQYSGVYQICSHDQNAAPITHSTLLASLATATSSLAETPSIVAGPIITTADSSVTSSTTSVTTSFATSSTTSVQRTTTAMSSTLITTHVSAFGGLTFDTSRPPSTRAAVYPTLSTTASSTRSAAAATSTAATQPVLSGGQVAGITVAGVAISAAVIGLLAFIFCSRRHRERRRKLRLASQGSFIERQSPRDTERGFSIGDGAADHKQESPLIPQPTAPPRSYNAGPKAYQFLGLPVAPNQHRQSWWNKFGKGPKPSPPRGPPVPPKPQYAGARLLTPTMGGFSSEASPRSIASYHTTSGLLPDKPAYHPSASQIHEKRLSGETTQGQPAPMANGVGLRIISATPEPKASQPLRKGWPQADTSQSLLQGQRSGHGQALQGKMSDPFLSQSHEQQRPPVGLLPAFRVSRESSRYAAARELDASHASPTRPKNAAARHSRQGMPNFRALVNPQTHVSPQLQCPVSPLTPEIHNKPFQRTSKPEASQYMGPIMNRPRGGSTSPFFSSKPSQYFAMQLPRRDRSMRSTRPETHYTTSSETEFEDDEPEPEQSFGGQHIQSFQPQNDQNVQSGRRGHVSVGGIAELPGLSPVTESPVSRQTPSAGNKSLKTPSPGSRSSPSRRVNPEDSDDEAVTPLSKVRYPMIPGSQESPRYEVKQINIAMGIPREAKAVPVGRLHRVPSLLDLKSNATDIGDDDDENGRFEQPNSVRMEPSPLRPSKPAQENLRAAAFIHQHQQPASIAELPATNVVSAFKFHDAASRLAASKAGIRAAEPERGLGNWPVQPVRPVLRQSLIPAPTGVPAFVGSQPSTPVNDLAFSPSNAGPYQVAQAVVNNGSGSNINFSGDGRQSMSSRPESSFAGRVLISGANGRAMHAPALSQTRLPAPVGMQPTTAGSQPAYSSHNVNAGDAVARHFPTNTAHPYQIHGQQGFQTGYTPRPPSLSPANQMPGPYQGPRLSSGPVRNYHGHGAVPPSRETQHEREMRLGMQRLRGWEQERRRELMAEQSESTASAWHSSSSNNKTTIKDRPFKYREVVDN